MTSGRICEIRVPTYKRPKLLRRALESLQAQTYTHWQCVVFDDSPDGEAEAVVTHIDDRRVQYRKNPVNLGISENLGICFQTRPIAGGDFACVLEDDNFFLPDCLRQNVAALDRSATAILLRNQCIERNVRNGLFGEISKDTTLSRIFFERTYSPAELLCSIFLGGGISNGSLFWRTECISELQLGSEVKDPVLQEFVRPFLIQEKTFFAEEPLAVWQENALHSFRLFKGRDQRIKRILRLSAVAYLRRLALEVMQAEKPLQAWIDDLPATSRKKMVRSILHSGVMPTGVSGPTNFALLTKGIAGRLLVPCQIKQELVSRINLATTAAFAANRPVCSIP
jgi:glycosyltransferase involved in cell wall biosynthesis